MLVVHIDSELKYLVANYKNLAYRQHSIISPQQFKKSFSL